LSQAIFDSIAQAAPATTTPGGTLPAGGQQFGQQQPFGQQQQFGQQQPFGQQQQPGGARPTTPGATAGAAAGGNTSVVLKLISHQPGVRGESGFLENVRLTADIRTNSIIVSSPATSTDLILALIHELDVPPTAQAEVKVFQLKKADASATSSVLQQMFLGTSAGTGTTARPPGTTGFPTTPGFPGTSGLGGQPGAMTFAETTAEGLSLMTLRTAVDVRTNSVIVAAGRGDMLLVEAIIARLDATDIRERRNEVYKLRNSTASDVATALTNFYGGEINVLSVGELTPFTQIERQIVVVPEAVSNTLLISADPKQYEKVLKMIEGIDAEPPQVVIQVLIGQVTLNDTDECGVQLGVQTPILFQRSIVPASGFFGTGTVSYATTAVPSGVTVSNSINPATTQGFNWLNTNPLGNNPVVGPTSLGASGLTDLAVNSTSQSAGFGGFVFRAASDSVNVLIRALKSQGRIDVLSRPQITALDNQVAYIQVGQTVPYINNSTVGVSGQIINTVLQQPVGVILQVTPRINKDGQTIMRVEPQISSLSTSTVNLGNNTFAPIFNITQASTTVIAQDGQTIAIGGLLTKNEDKEEKKVPWLGDIPYLGTLFRFRTYNLTKTELLILLTPHVVRSKADAERILAEETRKMNWCLEDVIEMHGPIFGDSSSAEPLGPPHMTPPDSSAPPLPTPPAPNVPPSPPAAKTHPIMQQGPWH
jgi:general secretion pathway protein D